MGKTVFKLNFNRGHKRIKIDIGNGTDNITGYGQFSNESSYPYPWYLVFPLIFKESDLTIAINYAPSKLKSTVNYTPSKLVILNTQEKYLPILFLNYVLLQRYIKFLI